MYDLPTFEKRFDQSFARVYAFVLARVGDRGTAELVTREVLRSSLESLLDAQDGDLHAELLRNTHRALREQGARATG
jgi:hypothetical protein